MALAVDRSARIALAPGGDAADTRAALKRLETRLSAMGFWRGMVDDDGTDWLKLLDGLLRTLKVSAEGGRRDVRKALWVVLDDLRPLTGAARERECFAN